MANRFTDTEKWNKPWFRALRPHLKVFWQYIIDKCNHAGIWDVDFQSASFFIGRKLNEEEVRKEFSKQYIEFHEGKKWYIKDFIPFQYGDLNPENRVHDSVIKILEKEGLMKDLSRALLGPKDKDKDKDKEVLGKEEDRFTFEDFWKIYPKKVGKKNAAFQWEKLSNDEHCAILIDIPNRMSDSKWVGGYVKDPERYLKHRQWEDEILKAKSAIGNVLDGKSERSNKMLEKLKSKQITSNS